MKYKMFMWKRRFFIPWLLSLII